MSEKTIDIEAKEFAQSSVNALGMCMCALLQVLGCSNEFAKFTIDTNQIDAGVYPIHTAWGDATFKCDAGTWTSMATIYCGVCDEPHDIEAPSFIVSLEANALFVVTQLTTAALARKAVEMKHGSSSGEVRH